MLDGLEKLERFERRLERLLGPTESTQSNRPSTELAARLIERWKDNPALYCKERLGLTLVEEQERVALDVRDWTHVCVHSGQKTGKSTMSNGIACWWSETRPKANSIITSSTQDQVKLINWADLRELITKVNALPRDPSNWVDAAIAQFPFPQLPLDPSLGIRSPITGNMVIGRVSGTDVGTQGFSGANLLIIADEASGIDESFFAAFEGNSAGGGRQLLLGNPNHTSGTFFECERKSVERGGLWRFHRLSSTQTINAREGRMVVPGLALREWCEERLKDWGADDPRYQVRVLGRPPSQASNSVVSLASVEAAQQRWATTAGKSPLSVGVDVARFGDDESVVVAVRGNKAESPLSHSGLNSTEVAGRVLEYLEQNKRTDEAASVTIDVGGGYGGGVVDQLIAMLSGHRRRDFHAIAVHQFNGAESPRDEQYANSRDESWFLLSDWLKNGGAIPTHGRLESDLLAPRYSFDLKGRRKIERKDEIKKRTGESPDYGDGLAMAIWGAQAQGMGWVHDPLEDD